MRFVSLSLQCPVECRRAAFRTRACTKQVSLQGGCDCNLTGVSRIGGVSGGPEKKRLLDCSLATGSSTNALGSGIVNRHLHRLLVFESKPKSSILVQDFSNMFRALLRPGYRMFSIERDGNVCSFVQALWLVSRRVSEKLIVCRESAAAYCTNG